MGTAVPVMFVVVFDAPLIVRSGYSRLSLGYDQLIERLHRPSELRGTFELPLNTGGEPVLDRCEERGHLGSEG